MTIDRVKEIAEKCGADLAACRDCRLTGSVPLENGHRIEIYAPVPVFFDRKEAKAYGKPCYVVTGGGNGWAMVYTTEDADIGFTGSEEEIAERLIRYIERNYGGKDPAFDAFLRETAQG